MTKNKTKNKTTTKTSKLHRSKREREVPTTLMGHLDELKTRLFWVVIFFIASAVAVYPFFTPIVQILTAPLNGQVLHYFTPAGGLSFIIKICMYLGVIGALPALVYHLYKFVQPVMSVQNTRRVIGYTFASVVLAVCGILFTYTIILPAAVKFLTSFEIADVAPVLSVDSYMSFVIAYIVAGALLFQLPLIMLLINTITPLSPSKLLSHERHVIVGAFVLGAILSPTPDVVNQSLLAMPLIVMYQLGFVLVVVKNVVRRRRVLNSDKEQPEEQSVQGQSPRTMSVVPPSSPAQVRPQPATVAPSVGFGTMPRSKAVSIDGVMRQRPVVRPSPTLRRPVPRHSQERQRSVVTRQRSVDGFSTYSYPN